MELLQPQAKHRSVLLRLCRKGRHWRPAPLDPSSALSPLHPGTKGLPPSVLPPAGIAGKNDGCRPGILTVIAPISGDFFFRRHHLKAMLFCVGTGGGFPFLAVRWDEPDRQPGLALCGVDPLHASGTFRAIFGPQTAHFFAFSRWNSAVSSSLSCGNTAARNHLHNRE